MKIKDQTEYDAAKEALRLERKLPSGNTTYIIALERDLLEYRRANNIFEVGDWVVSTLNLGLEPESMVCQIKFFHEGVVTTQSACGEIVNFHSSKFRHATNAEIKVKRRHDLPESVVKSLGEVS